MSRTVRIPLTVEQALLGFLRERPMHGYEIYQRLHQPTGLGLVWQLKPGQLYALLDRLEEEGYVSSTLEAQESRPPRKVFALTKKGRETFCAWLKSPVARGRAFRLEFLAKLYFAQRDSASTLEDLLREQRAACRAWLAEQQRLMAEVAEHDRYAWLVYRFRKGQIEAMLTWLDECAQTLLGTAPDETGNPC